MTTVVRPMIESDLPTARQICHSAFGTFLGAPDPQNFWADRDYVYGRFGAEHVAGFTAELDDEVVGCNFATRWGSVGFFGPLAVRPDLWDRGVAQPLVAAVSNAFEEWGVTHAGLATFPQSPKHIHLYGKFEFHPRFLTPLMVAPACAAARGGWSRYSELPPSGRVAAEAACREITDALYPGLDLAAEIRTVTARGLGDTLLLSDGSDRCAAFAVCHWGPAERSRRGLLLCQIRRGATGSGGRSAFRGAARCRPRAGRFGWHAASVGRGQSRARRGPSAYEGMRVSRRSQSRDAASAQRPSLQPAGPLCPR